MHPFSILTVGIFVAGYTTARWDLVTRLYELAIFAWDHDVFTRAVKGFAGVSIIFLAIVYPVSRIASREIVLHPRTGAGGISAREQLKRRGNGLMRIFWPSDAPSSPNPGVLVGWRNSDLDVLVVAILQDTRSVENAIRVGNLFRSSPYPIHRILERCGKSSLQVLGSVNPVVAPTTFNPASITCYTSPRSRFPHLFCPDTKEVMVQVILFDRPHPTRMQYISLAPISLALGDKADKSGKGFPPLDGVEAAEEREWERKQALVEKLKQHTVVRHSRAQKELLLPVIVDQINCSYELNALLQSNIGLIGTRSRRALSVGEHIVESASNLWDLILAWLWYIATEYIWPLQSRLFVFALIAHRAAGEVLLRILDWRLFPGHAALKDVSATAQQVDIRLQQFCYWPIQYLTLRKRKQTWQSITNSHPEYIRFYNSLWLVANDVIIGIALGSYIIENATFVAAQVDKILTAYTIQGLQATIIWLMDWPAGLKLNTELATFLGDLFLWVIDYWAGCMAMLRPYLPGIIHFIGFSSFAGATMPISLFSDLVSLLTLHIYSFYVAAARIYNWQLTIIISLFHLFRGKKRNVLRNRIDSCDYDLDQLLLGTILFTLLFFLLPTVFVFYACFAVARMVVIGIKAGLDTALACLNHFPLFALMLRFKDSRRLPGGIMFELRDVGNEKFPTVEQREGSAPTSFIHLKSVPLPLRAMLNEYFQLGNRISKHYVSPGVILCLITGRFVPPIHRKNLYSLQYSMLPKQRVGIYELWARVTEKDAKVGDGAYDLGLVNGGFGGNGYVGGGSGNDGYGHRRKGSGNGVGRVRVGRG
ncbi:phosphatidylinositol N-acetylglucosaminyltransferase subunit GPI1 [Tothia fuscella]|uniref:Phosphatidylinositol N-acetylglucosaminyltransferase subunit GPI1 n=1 Tax=Tothia fuscella TaxID=1048955 RepID=A0A9P4NN30_9PEZI|nr:phosphatidylinositol N-acetylglucosaminyltransferase subunit GPI1 [Tothia fuscella]